MSLFEVRLKELGWNEAKDLGERLETYRRLVLEANKTQNLTRIVEEEDFWKGHVLDCVELVGSGLLGDTCVDVGSGLGVPGIPSAILGNQNWILAESEGRKAEFLESAVNELGLGNVKVFHGRAEDFLKGDGEYSLVARAVAPIWRFLKTFKKCSTWNKAILLKGPAWKEEWDLAEKRHQKSFRLAAAHEYEAAEKGKRVILALERSTWNI